VGSYDEEFHKNEAKLLVIFKLKTLMIKSKFMLWLQTTSFYVCLASCPSHILLLGDRQGSK